MHHGQDPDVIGSEDINHGIRKRPSEMAPRVWGAINAEERGLGFDFRDQLVNVSVKFLAEFGSAGRVTRGGVFEVGPRFRMETGVHHKPTILRTSAMT
jgi:hypothetical protein